jgi:hypothetical protein
MATPFSLNLAPKLRIPAWWQAAAHAPGPEQDHQTPRATVESSIPALDEDTSTVSFERRRERLEPAVAAPRATAPPSPPQQRDAGPALLVAIWGLGFSILLARLVIGHLRVRRMAGGATALDAAADLAGCLEPGRPVRFPRARRCR